MANLRPSRSVLRNFESVYPQIVRRYLRRGRSLASRQAGNEELHEYRIRTKRMRYITELYAEVFPRALDFVLRELRGIQEVLGRLQDQTMVISYFEQRLIHIRTMERQTEYLRVLHRARVRQSRHRLAFFRRWRKIENSSLERRITETVKKAVRPAPTVRRTGR